MIVRVFVNLLTNAIKHSEIQSVVRIDALREWDPDQVWVSFTDFGSGISMENIPYVFDPYWQQQSKSSSHFGVSTGLGLSFCKMAMEAHGGSIGVVSKKEEGSTFTLNFREVEVVPDHHLNKVGELIAYAKFYPELTQKEKKLIKQHLPSLFDLKIHQISKLRKELLKLDQLNVNPILKTYLHRVIELGDEHSYNHLLSTIKT